MYSDCKRDAVDLLLKASGYLEACVKQICFHMPPNVKYVDELLVLCCFW